MFKNQEEERKYADARSKELQGLIVNNTFLTMAKIEVPDGTKIFDSSTVDSLKTFHKVTIKKSRLVEQNYRYQDATEIPPQTPAISRFSEILMISLAPSLHHRNLFMPDVTQAYMQRHVNLEREVLISAPEDMYITPSRC